MMRVFSAILLSATLFCPSWAQADDTSSDITMRPYMRLRTGFDFVQADPNVAFVGRNDGFKLDQARLGFTGSYKERLSWTMIMDGVSTSDPNANDPIAHVRTALRDAFLHWHATEFFNVWLGQTFMPGDYEGMISRRELNFSARSVASQGVGAGLGYQVAGLSAGRQTGVVLGARDLVAGILHLDYRMALANGNGINVTGNDNEQPAFYSRFAAGLSDWVQLGLGFQYNPRTVGELPNLYTENDVVALGDLKINVWGLDMLAQAIWRQTSYDTSAADSDEGLGLTTWLVFDEPFGLNLLNFKPGIRFSYLDPSSFLTDDQLQEITVGIRYDAPISLPVTFMVDYTVLTEETARALANDRLVAMFQITY